MRVAPSHTKPTRHEKRAEAAGEMVKYIGSKRSRINYRGQKMGDRLNIVGSKTRCLLEQHSVGLDRSITNLHRL